MMLRVVVSFVLLAALYQPLSAQTSFAEANRTKKAQFTCLFTETPGYIETRKDGKVAGMLPEIMSAFSAHLKMKFGIDAIVRYQALAKDTPINDIFSQVHKGEDGLFGMVFVFITEERKKLYSFSDPIFMSPSFLLTSTSTQEVTGQGDLASRLKGFTAYVNKGNYYEAKFLDLKAKSVPDLKIGYYDTYSAKNIAETLAKDKAMTYVDISGFLYAMENKIAFRNHKALQFTTPMGITLSKRSTWKEEFNNFLQSGFLKSTEFKKIITDNLGYPTLKLLGI